MREIVEGNLESLETEGVGGGIEYDERGVGKGTIRRDGGSRTEISRSVGVTQTLLPRNSGKSVQFPRILGVSSAKKEVAHHPTPSPTCIDLSPSPLKQIPCDS